MRLYSFEKLSVYDDIRKLVKFIYSLTSNFPLSEKFGLTSQLRRAAVSVLANLAEGTGRVSAKEQAHFFQISYSSLLEVLAELTVASEMNYMNSIDQETRNLIEKISYKLSRLRAESLNRTRT